eukprot:CFRG2060T1
MLEFFKTESRVDMENIIGESYPTFDFEIQHDDLLTGVKQTIKHFKPEWPDHKKQFRQFTAGLTNKLFLCSLDGTDEKCLCRIYGKNTSLLIDRDQELVNIISLQNAGLSPKLIGRFRNGFCYGFLEGEPLDTSGMSDEIVSPLTAKALGMWHRTHVSGDMSPMLWETIDRWLECATPKGKDKGSKPSVYDRSIGDLSLDDIRQEIFELRQHLDSLDSPVVFCHNDLLCNNILYNEKTETVAFIDYEYGNYSYRGFDVGNHFCEFAGMEDPVDYSLYPSEQFQREWLRNYLSEYRHKQDFVTDEDVDTLYREVNKFALAAHIYWGVWSLVQAKFSDIDFDYGAYSRIRFKEYLKNKEKLLAL